MKRWKKVLLAFLVLVLLSQIPFAYRRYKLGRLHAAILNVESKRSAKVNNDGYAEYRGVMHVHSFLGGHSTGSFQEIIEAARSNQLNFVLMSEHPAKEFNTAEMTLTGFHSDVLFINGNEVSTSNGDRLLLFPGDGEASKASESSTAAVLSQSKAQLKFIAYPEEFKSWDAGSYTGVEVFNVYTNARTINPVVMFFDGLWSYRSYPELLFATFYTRPTDNLRKWDEELKSGNRKLVAVAGNDAHSNVGLSLNDSSGKTLIGVKLDPYDRSFRLVRVHVLVNAVQPFNAESLLTAMSQGNCFTGFDLFGDTSGFRFIAQHGAEQKIMGDEISLDNEVALKVEVPATARIQLLKDGAVIKEESGVNKLEFVANEKGTYRVEVYLPELPHPASNQPWIISNPIYVR